MDYGPVNQVPMGYGLIWARPDIQAGCANLDLGQNSLAHYNYPHFFIKILNYPCWNIKILGFFFFYNKKNLSFLLIRFFFVIYLLNFFLT
jgi:hypothetical protein